MMTRTEKSRERQHLDFYLMKKQSSICFAVSVLVLAVLAVSRPIKADELARGFATVPDVSKPGIFWWWLNCLVNKEGITRDLEEFRKKGIGSVLIWCTANGYHASAMPSGPKFLSAEWRDLYRHAVQEAARLDIEISFNLCGGYDMGGPWITPINSGRWFLQSQLTVNGPQKFSGALPLPGARDGYEGPNTLNVPTYIDLPLAEVDYRDSAVVAFLEPDEKVAQFGADRLKLLSAKSNRLDGHCFIPAQVVMAEPLVPWTSSPNDNPIKPLQVVDLTKKLSSDGHLEWDVPAGRWTILRTGHRMTGARVSLALPESSGLEVDWLNGAAVEQQFDNLAKVLIDEAGPLAGKTLKYLHDDSFEDGYPNWTDTFLQKFLKYRGYDAKPYLPVFTGRIVGSAEVSDRFLYDYRKTVADCMADGHYGRFAELSHEHGLKMQSEAAGPSWSGTMCMDGLKNLGRCDRPMAEFWQDDTFVELGQNKTCKQAASAAHIYGRGMASAEAFTSLNLRHWADSPASLKPTADRAFCEGINRFVIHYSASTRPEDGKPGYVYGAGTHFNPNVTWWDKSGAWLAYFGRCQYLLQEGQFVADVLYYNGDWAPNLVLPKHVDPSLGTGYDYDVCNGEVLLTRLSVKDGKITLPDGMSYRLLVLPETDRMPVEVVEKISSLVKAGGTVVGPKPISDPGLKDYPKCDEKVQELAAKVWGDCDGANVTEHAFGKGRVFWNRPLRKILLADGVKPDFETRSELDRGADALGPADGEESTKPFLDFIHRKIENAEVYFVANRQNREEKTVCYFRVSGRQPELWNPLAGEVRDAVAFKQVDGRTAVPLEFAPYGSLFVVFRKPIGIDLAGTMASNYLNLATKQTIEGSWTVKFNSSWGGPESVEFAALEDWSKRPEEEIKHYSGTATYIKRFNLDAGLANGSKLFLDLGEVKEVAQVRLNGQDLGVVWTAPWQVDISKVVKPVGNDLEIEIVNLWPNRLVGDAALPEDKRLTNSNIAIEKDAPLLPSGLIGPVRIMSDHQ